MSDAGSDTTRPATPELDTLDDLLGDLDDAPPPAEPAAPPAAPRLTFAAPRADSPPPAKPAKAKKATKADLLARIEAWRAAAAGGGSVMAATELATLGTKRELSRSKRDDLAALWARLETVAPDSQHASAWRAAAPVAPAGPPDSPHVTPPPVIVARRAGPDPVAAVAARAEKVGASGLTKTQGVATLLTETTVQMGYGLENLSQMVQPAGLQLEGYGERLGQPPTRAQLEQIFLELIDAAPEDSALRQITPERKLILLLGMSAASCVKKAKPSLGEAIDEKSAMAGPASF